MNALLRTLFVPSLFLLGAASVVFFTSQREAARARAASVSDTALTPSQDKLLELAFRAASALPANPHARTRGRLQQDVVDACLALDVPHRGLACAEKIEDWRRALGYAGFACYAASHGATEDVQRCLDVAQQISEQGEPTITQDWQRGRIRVAIARTHAWLGHSSEAAAFESGVEHAEMGKVDAVRVLRTEADAFDGQLRAQEAILASGDFDLSRNALETCTRLFERYYADAARRTRIQDTIEYNWKRIPLTIRIETLIELAGIALAHQDQPKTLELVNQARALLAGDNWLPENYVPFAARLGALRFRAGAQEAGRAEVEEALARFDEGRVRIIDIYRAAALRPVAEAWHAMGDRTKALALYERAIDESLVNPNSRPRVEDLVATCLSLAKCGIEPDAQLAARLEKVFAELNAPW